MTAVDCVLDCRCWLGEGPSWSAAEGALYWTDVPARRIHRWQPATGARRSWDMPEMVTSLALRAKGGLIVAAASGIDFFDPETGRIERFVAPERDKPGNRSNDGKCDRRGRFWYGTMMNNLAPDGSERPITARTGGLYRIDPDGRVTTVEQGLGIANTLAWSPDDRTMYFGDTFEAIYAYDFDPASGRAANRRVFAKTDGYGHGDGSTIDTEGFLWNARWDGGCLIRWAPDGRIDRVVELPCRRVTSAIFGGPGLDVLYVTTARYGFSEAELAEQPGAGGIFAVETGTRGLPDGAFAG